VTVVATGLDPGSVRARRVDVPGGEGGGELEPPDFLQEV
jgi:hypothetical protein